VADYHRSDISRPWQHTQSSWSAIKTHNWQLSPYIPKSVAPGKTYRAADQQSTHKHDSHWPTHHWGHMDTSEERSVEFLISQSFSNVCLTFSLTESDQWEGSHLLVKLTPCSLAKVCSFPSTFSSTLTTEAQEH